MAANFGEKIPVSNKLGRPMSFDLDLLAKDLVDWSKLPDSLNLTGFACKFEFAATKFSEWANKHEVFHEALVLAKQNISQNRFKAACLDLMPTIFYSRCEGMYDPLYHEFDHSEKKFESDLKKDQEGAKASTIILKVNDDMRSGINIQAETLSNSSNTGTE